MISSVAKVERKRDGVDCRMNLPSMMQPGQSGMGPEKFDEDEVTPRPTSAAVYSYSGVEALIERPG